ESHHAVTPDGLSVWYTVQVSPHSRIQEVVFERADRLPTDEECRRWLDLLIVGARASEAGSFPGAMTRRFEAFDRNPELVAQTALVEPGVVNQELSLAAAQHGLFYAPDPSSQKACTIGGNAAENSGGPHCLYYGVTTNHVLGMEVVLADGSVHWVNGDTPDRVGL